MMYIHSKGILHRDLKLNNILLDVSLSRCVIIDFGLSTFFRPGKALTTHCGTCEYAAPELFSEAGYGSGEKQGLGQLAEVAEIKYSHPGTKKENIGVA